MAGLSAADRLEALARAVRAGEGVLPGDVLDRARGVTDRGGRRLRLSPDHTVVALAGSTGSGKSSLVNALAGVEVAEVGVVRPTTGEAVALVRGADGGEGAAQLLDHLGVRRRHVVDARGPVDGGLVLLDLPDHDSVRTAHRLEAERLVGLVDLMVWVTDPQKYADAALHERYLRGLAAHRDVVLVVLNQVDRLAPDEVEACRRDLARLLAADGLDQVPVLATSARTGAGVAELRAVLDGAARRRRAAQDRVVADVVTSARELLDACGEPPVPGRATRATTPALVRALEDLAGVPRVVVAVREARVARARRATGWPPTRWLARLRPDPLRRLHLADAGPAPRDAGTATHQPARTSLPPSGAAERARARTAVRAYADEVTAGAGEPWVLAARAEVERREEVLADRLDRAVATTPLLPDRRPAWWGVVGAVQWVLLAVLVAGLAWLGGLAVLDALRLPAPQPPRWGEVPWPTVAVVGGAGLGLLLALLARLLAAAGGRAAGRRAAARLRSAVDAVARDEVVVPVADVLARLAACHDAARTAAGPRDHRPRRGGTMRG